MPVLQDWPELTVFFFSFLLSASDSLLSSYRHTWKSRHNHFLRRSDVRARDERRPTVNELAAEKGVNQKLDGWKVFHVSAQMEDVVDIEHQLSLRLSGLHRKLEKALGSGKDHLSKDLGQVQEIIKANLQRSKVSVQCFSSLLKWFLNSQFDFKRSQFELNHPQVIQSQIRESRDSSIKVFDHKKRVTEILSR